MYADYFPSSPKATTGRSITVSEHLENWIKLHPTLADSTIKAYRIAVNFWKSQLKDKSLKLLRYSDVLEALAKKPGWSDKTRNNKVSVLRQALDLAVRDELIAKSPLDGFDAAPHQKEPPDPFSRDEADLIVAKLHDRFGEIIGCYFEFKFYTGLRTGESLAVRWENIDFHRKEMLVKEAITMGEHLQRTKTYRTRIVELNSVALSVLQRMRKHTQLLNHGFVFVAPETMERWGDDSGSRKRYWTSTLKSLGIRHRGPYNTRHTYATIMLMTSVTPAYAARQLGHSVEMFLRLYAKWLDGGHNALEMSKIEAGISPKLPQKTKKGKST